MALVDPSSLPHVVDADAVSALGDRLTALGNSVVTAMSQAHSSWSVLREVFDVSGAAGVYSMLDRPNADAVDFSTALSNARNALWNAASVTLPDLKRRRDELATRIGTVNADYETAEANWQTADSIYRSRHRNDPDSSSTAVARSERSEADRARSDASDAGDALRDDIANFLRDVEAAESTIASELNGIVGGTEVHGAWGEPVNVSQTFWGYVDAPYPGAPFAATMTLSERLVDSLSDGVASRINWLGTADPADVERWMAKHPHFAAGVGFVHPDRAASLWNDLAGDSVPGDLGRDAWMSGPLAQFLALAPLAIGNLNGVPASQRNLFSSAGLRQLLAQDNLDDGAREKLLSLSRFLEQNGDASLLSVFLDRSGEPRASVAFGDVDTADQVTTMTHGIATDLGALGDWGGSAGDLKSALDSQLTINGSGARTAVVLMMEWDSGNMFTVQGIDRPDAGAARLTQLLSGLAQTNPGAQQNLVLHSLGTTMGSQAIAANPGLIDNVWFFGSAGLTRETGAELVSQIASGDISAHATHASADWVAPLGRTDALSSHPVDPRNLDGVQDFSAEGGFVSGYGPHGQTGEQTEGHNSQQSEEILYWGIDGWSTGIDGSPVPEFDSVSTGYLDPTAESFLHLVVGLADAAGAR